jgi:hypothetical protein
MSCPGVSVPPVVCRPYCLSVLSRGSCPAILGPDVLSNPSFHGRPVPAVLLLLSCCRAVFPMFFSCPSCLAFFPGCPAGLSFPGISILADILPASPGSPVQAHLLWLSCHGCAGSLFMAMWALLSRVATVL